MATTTVINLILNFGTDFGSTIAIMIIGILGLLAAVVGLGWGIRAFMRWIGEGYYEGITGEMLHEHDYRQFRNRGKSNEM